MKHPMYENIRSIYSNFAKRSSGQFLQEDGFSMAASGTPIAFMNAMLVDEMEAYDVSLFEEKSMFFENLGNDFLIFLSPNLSEEVVGGFKKSGLEVVAHPFFSNEIVNLKTDYKSELSIKRVSSAEDLKVYMDVFFEGFEMKALEKYKDSVYEAYLDYGFESGNLINYLGFDSEGSAVCTATMHIDSDFAGFYNVCVLKEHRQKKYGFDISTHLFNEARGLGVSRIGCNSSPEGLVLYNSLGLKNHMPNLTCFVRNLPAYK
ncbi:MAG: hypothetical protein VX642_03965 [Bdellovibrionota bacterium]|nr:hypothetical protein [Bdellovibrionota bacterium]